jgi:hypothetical protein
MYWACVYWACIARCGMAVLGEHVMLASSLCHMCQVRKGMCSREGTGCKAHACVPTKACAARVGAKMCLCAWNMEQ